MDAVTLLRQIEEVGRSQETGGYRRFTWTDADREMREWFSRNARSREFDVEPDGNGNLWAYRGDRSAGAVVGTGSHLDSVPDGGQYDGPLGLASAFAALDLLDERRQDLEGPLAIVAFAEEEGARFGTACLGSRLVTGAIDPAKAAQLTDEEGITWGEAMAAAGQDSSSMGQDAERIREFSCFVELHIEQGRTLRPLGAPLGIATEIWPHQRFRFILEGEANHAGTTSMEERLDPMPALAAAILKVTEHATRAGARATFGRLLIEPNGINAIPSRVTGWLDARAPTTGALETVSGALRANQGIDVRPSVLSPSVAFDADLRERIAKSLESPPQIPTAAGHDAGILANFIPTAMIFVRNGTGISHSPRENADPADIDAGVEALAMVLADLANA